MNNQSYFKADKYEDGYSWFHKNGTSLSALNIEEILRVSAAGADIMWNDNMPSNKQRQSCLIIAHLVSQRPEWLWEIYIKTNDGCGVSYRYWQTKQSNKNLETALILRLLGGRLPLRITYVNCCIFFACCGPARLLPQHETARPDALGHASTDVRDMGYLLQFFVAVILSFQPFHQQAIDVLQD